MITDAKISSAAKISPAKIAPAQVGQLMVAQADGKYAPVTISGDANLAEDGKLRLKNLDEITERAVAKAGEYFNRNEDALKRSDLKKGKTLVGGATTPLEVPVGTGASAIPQRDASGDLQAENSAKLNSQDPAYYTNTDNQTAGTSTTTTGSNGVSWTTQTVPFEEVVATFQYQYNGTGYGGTSFPIVHNLGYIPSCKTYKVDGSNLEEVEMNVVSTTTTTTVSFNYINFDMKVILR